VCITEGEEKTGRCQQDATPKNLKQNQTN